MGSRCDREFISREGFNVETEIFNFVNNLKFMRKNVLCFLCMGAWFLGVWLAVSCFAKGAICAVCLRSGLILDLCNMLLLGLRMID